MCASAPTMYSLSINNIMYSSRLTRPGSTTTSWICLYSNAIDSVITSYSIHYTKLYDCTFSLASDSAVSSWGVLSAVSIFSSFSRAVDAMPLLASAMRGSTGSFRIPSYNVCYTKLLRGSRHAFIDWQHLLTSTSARLLSAERTINHWLDSMPKQLSS